MTRPADYDTRGIVRPGQALEHFTLSRMAPDPPLDRFLDRFWMTAWDLPEPFEQTIVTPPAVNLVFEPDGTAILSGIMTNNFLRRLDGRGWVFGLLFRPGGFRPFVSASMAELTDRRVPISDVFGNDGRRLADEVATAADHEARRLIVNDFFVERCPISQTKGEELSTLIEEATGDDLVNRVSDLAERFNVSTRTLQRLFIEHVGVGPKWVLDRCRVQAAAERARRPVTSWADVANELGYADQAHLTVDVSQSYGLPPASYARVESDSRQNDEPGERSDST